MFRAAVERDLPTASLADNQAGIGLAQSSEPQPSLATREYAGTPPTPRRPGWRVTPAPGGRGAPAARRRRARRTRWRLAPSWSSAAGPEPVDLLRGAAAERPVRIPYSPNFLTEVNNGNVNEISSTGDAIQGTFKAALKYPPNSTTARPTTLSRPRSRHSPTTRS